MNKFIAIAFFALFAAVAQANIVSYPYMGAELIGHNGAASGAAASAASAASSSSGASNTHRIVSPVVGHPWINQPWTGYGYGLGLGLGGLGNHLAINPLGLGLGGVY